MRIKNGRLLYHLTHIDNLESILNNGLLSRNDANQLGSFLDVANQDIIRNRHHHELDDYVLFHFHPYSAFDVAVKETYGKENFVYITITRELARENNFKIVPRHPLNGEFELFDYEEGFQLIDWETMETQMKDFTDDDEKAQAKQIKMAECISEEPISASDFFRIHCNKKYVNDIKGRYNGYRDRITEGVWLN